jgi:hypothetical protein
MYCTICAYSKGLCSICGKVAGPRVAFYADGKGVMMWRRWWGLVVAGGLAGRNASRQVMRGRVLCWAPTNTPLAPGIQWGVGVGCCRSEVTWK